MALRSDNIRRFQRSPIRPDPGPLPDDCRRGPAEPDQTRRQPVADPAPQSPDLQQKYRQFLDLLPLTIALAGLPPSEGRLFGEDQIEGRGITVKMAYRVARNVAKECLGGS
jgi:hypothetical protein